MRLAFAGPAWHGPSVLEVLDGVTAEMAAVKQIAAANSIWTLVQHLSATQAILLRRLRGETAGVDDAEFWPTDNAVTPAAWQELLNRLRRQEDELDSVAARLTDEQLAAGTPPHGTSAYDMLHGHAQHSIYHAGQIALLKKAIAALPS